MRIFHSNGLAFAALSVLILGWLAGTPAALAQTTIQPEKLIDRPEVDRPEIVEEREIIFLPDEEIGAPDASTEKVFKLKGVILEGSEVYTDADIDPIVAAYLGQEVSFADLNAIAQAVTRKYRIDGFVLSQAVLPPQDIEGGILRLQAVEGRVTSIEIQGEYRERNGLIQRMADRILTDGPLNTGTMERYLLLIDDLPGITARGAIQPGDIQGGATLIIAIEQDMIEGSVGLDNLGSVFIGRYRGTVVGAVNSAFAMHDRTTVRAITTLFANQTRELTFGDIMHEQQIGSDGLRIRARGAFTHTHPGERLRHMGLEGESWNAEIQALYPMIRSRQFNINALAGFRVRQSKNFIFSLKTSRDRTRQAWIGGELDFTDPLGGVTQIELRGTHGFEIWNSTDDGLGRTRANGAHHFVAGSLRATRIQTITGGVSARVTVRGQLADDPLLAGDEVSFGGTEIGRAYDFAEIVGDDGIGAVAELRWAGPPVHDLIESYQFYGFYDFASVWNQKPVVAEPGQISMASAGAGVRFNFAHEVSGFFEFGVPLTKVVGSEGDNDLRLFFSLRKRF
ncbi:MAG: hypothetical protein O7A03_01965 [Alphaproteobacteria bacterium]|nr:hypothetical protein [Alphaproteobacteria bacterium]